MKNTFLSLKRCSCNRHTQTNENDLIIIYTVNKNKKWILELALDVWQDALLSFDQDGTVHVHKGACRLIWMTGFKEISLWRLNTDSYCNTSQMHEVSKEYFLDSESIFFSLKKKCKWLKTPARVWRVLISGSFACQTWTAFAPHPAVTPHAFIRRRFRDAIYTDWTCGDWSEVFWATPTLTHLDNKKKRAGAAVRALIRFQWGDCDSSITSSSKTRGHVAHLPRIHLPPPPPRWWTGRIPPCLPYADWVLLCFFCFPYSFFAHPHFQMLHAIYLLKGLSNLKSSAIIL